MRLHSHVKCATHEKKMLAKKETVTMTKTFLIEKATNFMNLKLKKAVNLKLT